MQEIMKKDIFEVLARFKEYSPQGSGNCNLETLSTFVNGYETALLQHNIEEVGVSFNRDFSNFLSKKYQLNAVGKSWSHILNEACNADVEKSWKTFFTCLEEFEALASE